MAASAYQGHAAWSVAKAVATTPDNVAPAERNDYDPAAVDPDVPGAAARASGWPRHDGKSSSAVR